VIAAGLRKAAQRGGGTVAADRYEVLVWDRTRWATSRSTATAIEVAAAEAANDVIDAAEEYRLYSARHGPPDPRRGVPR
jgi:hypothetical protein